MADLQLAIAYKPRRLRWAYGAITFLKWLWFIVLPTIWLTTMLALMLVPQFRPLFYSNVLFLMFGLAVPYAVLAGLGVLLTWPVRACYLKVSKDGLTMPFFMPNHIWSEVVAATVDETAQSGSGGHLFLKLDAGPALDLELDAFDKSELEQFLLALEMWASNLDRSPELIDFQTSLQNQNKGVQRLSYTTIWEDELSRRFTATSFVPLEPGHELRNKQFKVIRQLAFGGLSAIYLVQEKNTELRVLKEAYVPPNADQNAHAMAEKHLAREARLLATLKHPHIAQVLDHFVEDKRSYLVLEYITGQDLRQLVRQHGPQTRQKVLDWAQQIASILSYLHSLDPPIIHRDLTPDNLVLKNDGTIVLIDFGASNQFVGTATGTLVGKQAYIAPEQFRGKATCQSDLYAYGATIFFLLTGRDPVPLSTCHPRTVLPELSQDVDEFVASLTNPDPNLRVKTAEAILERVDDLLDANASVATIV